MGLTAGTGQACCLAFFMVEREMPILISMSGT
jgi:hypothetical protein